MAGTSSRSAAFSPPTPESWLAGGGEMGRLVRAMDWSKTPLGPIENWSLSLRMMVSFLLANRLPLLLWWGPEYISIYNDAYRPVLGSKHPWALGLPFRECWHEVRHVLEPLIDAPFKGGPATWMDDIPLEINRYGFFEETHFTIAYSPVPDDTAQGGIGGVLAMGYEITDKIVGERRIVTLRDLGARAGEAKTAEGACKIAVEALTANPKDIPFALLYLIDSGGKSARLAAASGVALGEVVAPLAIDLASGSVQDSEWPLAEALHSTATVTVGNLAGRFRTVPSGPWSDPPQTALIVPIKTNIAHQLAGFLVAGVSPRLRLDEQYRSFFELVSAQIATTIANARAYEEERKRAEALAEIDRAKTLFFSNVSHEFRTPLTLMLGPLQDALARGQLPEGERARLDVANRNALRLLKLVNSLLDFARIEAGRAQASYEPLDLASLTAELAGNFRSACERADLALVVDCPALPDVVHVDRDMWEKIVLNLLSNAYKFTFAGEIVVRLRAIDGRAELTVSDTGVGIPEHELPRLFERFHRIEGQRCRTYEGSGIGLALVQELVRLHGGTIAVRSRAGEGTVFTIAVPFGNAHLPRERIGAEARRASTSTHAEAFVGEALRWLPDSPHPDDRIAIEDAGSHSASRDRVLVADDNADMRAYVRRLLEPRFDVETVADGQAALDVLHKRRPDLVITDVMMPGLDGFGLLRAIRDDPGLKDVPVIMLSARAGEESRLEGLAAGADDYLVKPFPSRELIARVESSLRLARVRADASESLRESEERFRMLADNMNQLAWTCDKLGNVTWYNQRWLDYTGLSFEDMRDSGWTQVHHPDHVDRVVASVTRSRESGEPWEDTFPLRGADGNYRWFLSRAVPIRNAAGEVVRWFGTNTDITEQRKAEETQRMLTNELSHRVKNMLATVQAVATQTLRHNKNPAQFVTDFGGRIQSMSRVHSMLSNSDWQGADLREIVRDQLFLGPVDDTRVTAWGPAVRLEAQMAPQVAMMLHELGTNSIKHGALSKADGFVTISWTVSDDVLRLRWAERGGPHIKVPVRRGFGTALIEQSARGAGGSARMSIEAKGVQWDISLPLPRPAAAPLSKTEFVHPTLPASEIANADAPWSVLAGKRFLVIEDEPLVALDIAASLEQAGIELADSVGSTSEALAVIERSTLDAALLDANLHGQPVAEIAAALTRKNVPFLFVTGYGRESLPPAFSRAAVLPKPFSQHQLLEAAAKLVQKRADIRELRR